MNDLNKVLLSGRLTADPELRQTTDGTTICRFSIASNRRSRNNEDIAEFVNIVTWKNTAEFVARNFSKGRMIIVEGSLRSRSYMDKRYPDVRRHITEVHAVNVYTAGDKKEKSPTDILDFDNFGEDMELPF